MPFTLPEVEHENYAQPPLRLAACQIRFSPILGIAQQQGIAPFQERVRGRYPTLGIEEQLQFTIGPQQPVQRSSNWRLSDLTDTWALTLAIDSVTLESVAYAGRNDFAQRWSEVLDALVNTLAPAQQLRFGLRYVNEIRKADVTNPSDWQRYVRQELSGVLGSELAAEGLTQSLTELRFSGDRGQATVKFGAFRAGTTIARPSQIQADSPFFLLDVDLSDTTPKEIAVDASVAKMQEFSTYAYRLFRWAVTDTYLAELRGSNG